MERVAVGWNANNAEKTSSRPIFSTIKDPERCLYLLVRLPWTRQWKRRGRSPATWVGHYESDRRPNLRDGCVAWEFKTRELTPKMGRTVQAALEESSASRREGGTGFCCLNSGGTVYMRHEERVEETKQAGPPESCVIEGAWAVELFNRPACPPLVPTCSPYVLRRSMGNITVQGILQRSQGVRRR